MSATLSSEIFIYGLFPSQRQVSHAHHSDHPITCYLHIINVIPNQHQLVKIDVPEELVGIHLNLSNNYSIMGSGLNQLNKSETDPVATITGLNTYSDYSDYEAVSLKVLANYFEASGIIFGQSDPGKGWQTI